MSDVTQILHAIDQGDPQAAEDLLPLVYAELRRLAAQKLAQEKPGQTLQATALVHDAYLRLVGGDGTQHWNSRGHFFSAAAEAMRRILIDSARRKRRVKHGGIHNRVDLDQDCFVADVIRWFGDGHIIYESDFPHPDSKFPHSVETFLALAPDQISDDNKARILWENAVDFYRFPESMMPTTFVDIAQPAPA